MSNFMFSNDSLINCGLYTVVLTFHFDGIVGKMLAEKKKSSLRTYFTDKHIMKDHLLIHKHIHTVVFSFFQLTSKIRCESQLPFYKIHLSNILTIKLCKSHLNMRVKCMLLHTKQHLDRIDETYD